MGETHLELEGISVDAGGVHDALHMLLEERSGERLGEEVGQVAIRVDMFGDDFASITHLLNPIMSNVDMLEARVVLGVFHEHFGSRVVDHKGEG